ncbi:hypothetical protein FHR32_005104 [Streptosporangium album]|uniref:Uncharacterized protein n=1 Tax=Streptosporangium album TaxID=47479 RepID=A0A7W7RZ33_9ACTN|nr:hypothetical protein [Streptosporangium album]MBB4940727.1 hypothetical protein [Streptosporangium album]
MADDLRPIRRREDLPPLERAVSDALDELNSSMHGMLSSWSYPVEFLEFLAEEGHTVVSTAELEQLRARIAEYEHATNA